MRVISLLSAGPWGVAYLSVTARATPSRRWLGPGTRSPARDQGLQDLSVVLVGQ